MGRIKRQGQLNKRCRETADAGFSLIELLIAVTILAIIVIPLLHMFVTSTRINVKSRQTLRATTVAQDIMEGLKAYTLEEVSAQFAPPEGAVGSGYHYPSDGFYIVNSSLIQGGVRDLTEDMYGHVEGDEIYYFGIENLKLQGGEYDALIKLDASTYGEDKDTTSAPHDNQFNGKFYAEIGSVAEVSGSSDEAAKATDSSYHESKKLAEAVMKYAKQDFEAQITAVGTLPDDWDEKWEDYKIEDIVTRRDIEIEIDDAGTKDAEGNEQCKATINFTYQCKCPYSGYSYTCTIYGGPESSIVPAKANISRKFSSGNFYLFYYPIYNTTSRVDYIKFEIKNESKLLDEDSPLLKQIVIVKQVRSDVDTVNSIIAPELTFAELQAKENSYDASVKIEPQIQAMKNLTVKTNFDTNMADGSEISHFNFNFNTYITPCFITGDNTSDKVTNVIYDIEIKVYKTGAAQHFTESHYEDNDDVQRLATITNMNQ